MQIFVGQLQAIHGSLCQKLYWNPYKLYQFESRLDELNQYDNSKYILLNIFLGQTQSWVICTLVWGGTQGHIFKFILLLYYNNNDYGVTSVLNRMKLKYIVYSDVLTK